jgi:hypothetical protein
MPAGLLFLMPADFYIDVTRRTVFSRGYDRIDYAACCDHMERLLGSADFNPEFNQLLDFRLVKEIVVSSEEIVMLAARTVFSPRSNRAFVVVSDLHFGLARMFGSYRECAGDQGIRLFRDMESALAWLALDAGPELRCFPKAKFPGQTA